MQRAFQPRDGTTENLVCLQSLRHDSRSQRRQLHVGLNIDVAKAFDTVSRAALTRIIKSACQPPQMVEYLERLYSSAQTTELRDGREGDLVKIRRGVKQGDPLSPLLFNLVIHQALGDIHDTFG